MKHLTPDDHDDDEESQGDEYVSSRRTCHRVLIFLLQSAQERQEIDPVSMYIRDQDYHVLEDDLN